MARLPTALDLSGPVSFRTGRMYASADQAAAGRGLASFGADLSAIGRERQQQADVVDIARAEAEKTKGLLEVQNEFGQDPDYSTYGKRAPEKTGKVVKDAANLIRNPSMRAKWEAGAQTDAIRTNDSIFDWGTKQRTTAETVAFDNALEVNRRIYVDPDTTPEAKQKAKADIEGAIQSGLETGLLDAASADARRKAFIEDAEFSRGKLEVERDPDVITRRLPAQVSERVSTAMGYFQSRGWTKEQAAGIVGNLIAESTLNTGARNGGDGADGSDSIGIAQWNSDRAAALKKFAGDKDWRDFGVQLAFVDHELRNNEKAAGDQLRSAKDVKSATEAMIMYERPAGSQNGAASAHNYKGRLKYAAQAAGEEVNPEWYRALSPEQRAVIDQQAETVSNQRSVETRAQIDVATANAPVAILNTGAYNGALPTAEQFFQAYGPQEGSQRYESFMSTVETSQTAYDMRTMSAGDIQAVLREAAPTSSGDNAALEQKRYETLSKAAETTLKAREADPAAYARQYFPSVAAAWADVGKDGGYQTAIAASVAAQQNLGITNIQPLPKDAAAYAVKWFKDVSAPEVDRIAVVSNALMATTDRGQRQAVFEQLVDAGLPDVTEGAFAALSRGDSGAAERLFRAAMVDPSKLPGTLPVKPAEIDDAIQTELMAEGEIGDIFYGLSDGTAENFTRAERDAKLITNSVNLRMRNGEDLDQAIAGVRRDLYGDVQVVNEQGDVNAQILLPAKADPQPVLDGLKALQPMVRDALTQTMKVPAGAPAADGTKAIMNATTANYVDNVMAEGYFRNSGDGYVFIDPFVGAAVAGPDGKPLIFTPADMQAAPKSVVPAAPATTGTDYERQLMEQKARQSGQFQ